MRIAFVIPRWSYALIVFAFVGVPVGVSQEATTKGSEFGAVADLAAKRSIRFNEAAEACAVQVRADPEFFEHKYVAVLRWSLPESRYQINGREDLKQGLFGEYFSPYTPLSKSYGIPDAEFFSTLASRVPTAHVPNADVLSFFQSKSEAGYVTLRRQLGDDGNGFCECRILALSVEHAKELSRGLLTLFDYGLTRPVLAHLTKQKEDTSRSVRELTDALANEEQSLQANRSRRNRVDSLTEEELSSLKTQQRLLRVDLAGVEARLQLVSKLLQNRMGDEQRTHLENIKIEAEIELAGLTARRKAIDEIVAAGEERIQLQKKVEEHLRKIDVLKGQLGRRQNHLDFVERLVKIYGPIGLYEDTITIRPVKWIE